MPNQINANTNIFKQNQNDVFGDGKDDTTSGNAGGIVTVSLSDGRKSTSPSVDGDLQTIDTASEVMATDPTANTTGNATIGYSRNFLLRWIAKILQVGLGQIRDRTLATATASNTSAANAAATFTIAAPGAGNYIDLAHLYFGYSAAPTAGTLTISATGLTSIVVPVTAAGTGFLPMPLRIPVNTACTVTLAAGGSGVVGIVNASYAVRGA